METSGRPVKAKFMVKAGNRLEAERQWRLLGRFIENGFQVLRETASKPKGNGDPKTGAPDSTKCQERETASKPKGNGDNTGIRRA